MVTQGRPERADITAGAEDRWPLPVYEPPTELPPTGPSARSSRGASDRPKALALRRRRGVLVGGVLGVVALAGAMAAVLATRSDGPTAREVEDDASADAPPAALGTAASPAAFGTVLRANPSWYVSVIDARPAEALVASFSDPPAPGNVHLAVDLELTYAGPDVAAYPGFLVSAYGTAEYTTYDTTCILHGDDVRAAATMAKGQTARFTVCVEVPTAEVDQLVYGVRGPGSFGEPLAFSPASTATYAAPPIELLDGPDAGPPGSSGNPLNIGAEPVDLGGAMTGAITEIADAVDDDLLADFALPPADGRAYVVVTAEVRNGGPEPAIPRVFAIAVGSEAYEAFTSECFLAEDVAVFEDLAPGASRTLRFCMDVPADEVDDLRFTLTGPSGDAVAYEG